MSERRRTAVLISGRGTNLEALIEATAQPRAAAEIALVVSDRAEAPGLERARRAGIATRVLDPGAYETREAFDRGLSETLQRADVEIVCLAGFMRILSAWLVERWRDRVLNIHPSLLPAFRGLDTHRRALEAGVRFHGCTVHFVRRELDAGPIVVQGVVAVRQDDTPETLAERVLALEHRCYPVALQLAASGRARVAGERVLVDGADAPATVLISPQGLALGQEGAATEPARAVAAGSGARS